MAFVGDPRLLLAGQWIHPGADGWIITNVAAFPVCWHMLRCADLVPSRKARLPVGDGAIWSEECLGPVRNWFCDFGDLPEWFEIKLDTES